MTSNLAQTEIADHADTLRAEGVHVGRNDEESSQAKKFINQTIYPILREHFRRDEFLGRINEVLFFLPFTTEELKRIVEMELERWTRRAMDRHRIQLSWTREVVEALTEGYNIRYGARSIKHEVEKRIVNQIAKAHELDQLVEGGSVNFTRNPDGTIRLDISPPTAAKKALGFWK
jgi:ATP-dependent Clp protease ATP-binding subunit ClpB